jgi:outer membrane biosynthesis protein TonB
MLSLALLGSLCVSYLALAQEEPSAVSQSPPVLPKVKSFGKGIYYPDQAKRLEAQGRILLGFQINDRGRATRITNVALVSLWVIAGVHVASSGTG